ncbi:glycosyl transferase family 2 [Chloroherpeton thalassium ATCC 35110]|uniref:Glycosyl transferase family 2 n=1 Tax=Chloroherpeton thalassium (strain ATCC 35110 / GB-78) TaxID=517418 RepID=B3QXQ8_CHLT3|nr:glycosyltransferase family 2 protein [Chloroherpeton thalassium]ACF14973.1 glycosyl transferase family 2 [Chloroherpeton thalassium ATCC 35110]
MIKSIQKPKVDIIIPHYNGWQILDGCLASLEMQTYPNVHVSLVDNGTTDGSMTCAKEKYPWANILTSAENLGYAGGCNYGFKLTDGKYVVFLNNDTEHEPDWIEQLVGHAEQHEKIAALQPKILSIQARNKGERVFDYAGAAGGLIDGLGYPYAMGRVFGTLEKDMGQYDVPYPIFWASGTAMFARRAALEQVGLFDDDFFAHMEEIDLCWRLLLHGYEVYSEPKAIVYHYGGATLKEGSPKKVYLNHRNNLMMIIKNRAFGRLLWILPMRMFLELVSTLFYYKKYGSEYSWTVLRALLWNIQNLGNVWRKRVMTQKLRVKSDGEIFNKVETFTVIKKVIFG